MLTYLIELTIAWSAFALLYRLLLKRETFFHLNRWYLLTTALLGLALPFAVHVLPALTDGTGSSFALLPAVTIGLDAVDQGAGQASGFATIFWVYWAGIIVTGGRMLWGLARIAGFKLTGTTQRLPDKCRLIRSAHARMPFSFFRWIFVPLDFEEENAEMKAMLDHERAHAHDFHSIDVLFAELLCVAFWFHPLAYWYRRALREVHEYLADDVAAGRNDRRQYGLLLLQQAQSAQSVSFVHHFFQSPLKQRLIMLTKKSSAPVRGLQYGLLLPTLVLLAVLFQKAPVAAQTTQTEAPKVYQECEKMPEFPGGQAALVDFLVKNMRYPPEAAKDKAEGMIVMEFVVNEDGSIGTPRAKSPDYRPDFVEESVRMIRKMPKWIPGEEKGQKVKCQVLLPIKFKLS